MRRLLLVIFLLLAPVAARADDSPVPAQVGPTADDWLRVGLERYERGNLVGAIDAFEKGHAREPRPMFLFALAQAHRKRGDCERARALFDAFLASTPPPAKASAAAALEQRERCEPAEAPAPPPPPPSRPQPVAAAAPVAPPPPARRGWWSDPVAVGAGGATVVLLGGGTALWLSAASAADGAATATTYDRHELLRERAESRQRYAAIALGLGAATAGITIWRLTRDRTEPRPPAVVVQPVVAPDGVGVSLGGHF